jgi:GntR family transcriptional repressor for pyruvate dehydrogenase complex
LIFKPITLPPPRRLPNAIAGQLERLIVEGRLTPGEGLPSERELAKQIGVSRPSLREALSELRSRGLIEPARNGGAVVTEITRATFTEPLSQLLARHPSAVKDLIEMRVVLEGHAAYLAAVHSTSVDLKKLESTLKAQSEQRLKNVATLAKRDLDFHQSVAQASRNIVLLHATYGLSRLINVFVQRGYEIILSCEDAAERRSAIVQEHFAIFEAIRGRDPEAARNAALAHVRSTEDVWTVGSQQPTEGRTPSRPSASRANLR